MNTETKVNETTGTAKIAPNAPGSLGIHASVSFGTSDGGPCVGKGICKLQSVGGTDVNFHVSYLNTELLFMIFSMTELKQKQPDQIAYFTDPSKQYPFDKLYQLDDQVFASLGLLPNARISPQSPTEVVINGDAIITLVKYDHD